MSTSVIFQIAFNSFICLLARTPVALTVHVLVLEMILDFIQALVSKAFARDGAIQDAPVRGIGNIYLGFKFKISRAVVLCLHP
jgi:hypothetical protein